MNLPAATEWIGYAASVLIAVSLLMSIIWRLRWINMAGALLFALYGLAIHSTPITVVNTFIAVIDAAYIVKMIRQRDYFKLLPISSPHNPYYLYFLNYYESDIHKFYPDFKQDDSESRYRLFILRNLLPVGLFIYEREGEIAHVVLDYVIPDYRDLKNAHYLYNEGLTYLRRQGLSTIRASAVPATYTRYLVKAGFEKKNTGYEMKLCEDVTS
jgi:hypothetical protein